MEKIYFDRTPADESNTGKPEKMGLDLLKQKLSEMDVFTELNAKAHSATVIVHKNVGTTMFLASGEDNHFWLRKNAIKVEDLPSIQKYHFVFD